MSRYYDKQNDEPKIARILLDLAYVIFGLILFFSVFYTVGAGERGVILTFGKVGENVIQEGLHVKVPFVQTVAILDVKTQKESANASAASKDLQTVTTELALNYHLVPNSVNKLWQNVGKEYKVRIIDPAIQEAIKAVTAKYTAEELITKRPQVKDDAKIILAERLVNEYIAVDELSIVNFDFSPSFNQAIEQKVTAEQNALAAKNKLEQTKYEAEQRIAQARGEAEAIKIQAQAITQQGGKDYVSLKWIEKWSGNLPQTVLGDAVPLVNIGR